MKIKKILVLGSGALKIGEAGEFDYSGSQAIKALKEEGMKTILVNPNIATVQTSKFLPDDVYFLPVNPYFVEKIIAKEKPQGILLSFGGQTALNCGIELYEKGILKKYNVKILGTPISGIILTEDRKKFADHLKSINIPTPKSFAAKNLREAKEIAGKMQFPVMIRSGFSLGGQGSGVAQTMKELTEIAKHAFSFAPQILIEQYLHHYKEIEYEVVRDKFDNCITVCNMENMDPLGIHTGESIVVAPSQTLNNFEYHHLREASIKIVRSLGIVGECNVQFALKPLPKDSHNLTGGAREEVPTARTVKGALAEMNRVTGPVNQNPEYYVIEVNARLSRSSALASKATGYPLAYVAAKLSLGRNLTDIKNKVTQKTQSCFEPALDYLVVKIPRWDIEKFKGAEEKIGSSMKSVGEVMGIGRTFEEAYQKAIRMLDLDFEGATSQLLLKSGKTLMESLRIPTPKRMFALAQALKEDMRVSEIYDITGIDPWFIERIKNIVTHESQVVKDIKNLTKEQLYTLKKLGFSDKKIGQLANATGLEIRSLRKKYSIIPSVFQIDTLAGEFEAKTNYLYLTYNGNHNDVQPLNKDGVIVLGSGPYRIGSSVEFDWTSVNTALALKTHGKKSIMINCNPETVSTDYDIADRLYFEELTFERIADIYDFENPFGVIISVGGQTPNNRAQSLVQYGSRVLGTHPTSIDKAEDRSKFSQLADSLGIAQPLWAKVTSHKEAIKFCDRVGYPVLLRPSYVLSGTLMRICRNKEELTRYIEEATLVSSEYPLTISKFIEEAKEIEMDAIAANGDMKAFIISEHVENAGVHSGDASIVLPPQKLYVETKRKIEEVGRKLALALKISGPFNIQFLAKDNIVQVIEINLRSSRTFPFISKVTGIDFAKLAVDAILKKDIPKITIPLINFVAVKVSQFSFARLTGADPILHVEMGSTGEVACFGKSIEEAFLKGQLAVGEKIPKKGVLVSLGGEENKVKFLESVHKLSERKFPLSATEKTAIFLQKNGIIAKHLYKIYENKSPNVLEYFQKEKIDLAINVVETHLPKNAKDSYTLRRAAIDYNISLFTNLKKAELFVKAITSLKLEDLSVKPWSEYV